MSETNPEINTRCPVEEQFEKMNATETKKEDSQEVKEKPKEN